MITNQSFREFSIFVLLALIVVIAVISVKTDTVALALTSREAVSLEKYFASERRQTEARVVLPVDLALAIYQMSERDRSSNQTGVLAADPLAAYHASEWQRTSQLAPAQEVAMAVYHQSEWNRNLRAANPGQAALAIYRQSEWNRNSVPNNPGQAALDIYHLSERDRTK